MTTRDAPPSQHYVDDDGRPVKVRGLYRSWIVGLLVVSAFSAYAAVSERSTPGFSLGVWAGVGVTSFVFAALYAWSWLTDRRHSAESRAYWASRNIAVAKRGQVAGGSLTAVFVLAVLIAAWHGHMELAGLGLALAVGSASGGALSRQARQRQRQRAVGD